MSTGGLLMNKVSIQARVQVPWRSRKWDSSESCHWSLCVFVGGRREHNLEHCLGTAVSTAHQQSGASLPRVGDWWRQLKCSLS